MNKISGQEFDNIKKFAMQKFEDHLDEMRKLIFKNKLTLQDLIDFDHSKYFFHTYDVPTSLYEYFSALAMKFYLLKIAGKQEK